MQTHPLTAYRDAHGINKSQLAQLLGTSRAAITRWESGARLPSEGLLARITKKTGISARDLRPDLARIIGK